MEFLTIWDLLLTPIFLLLLIALAVNHRNRKYRMGHPLRKYYMSGLYAKFAGALFIGLVYTFYYGGGDTLNYFYHARVINSALDSSFSTWFKLITHSSVDQSPEIYAYTSQMYWYNSPSEYMVCVITAILGLVSNTSYFPTTILFAFLSYSGIWAMFKTFANLYPKMSRPLSVAFLFIPSTLVWGSGIFKDTICMFGLGWLTYGVFRLFVNRDLSIKIFIFIFLSFYLVGVIKVYILLGFLPALALWLLLTYSNKIKMAGLRWTVNVFFVFITTAGVLFFMQRFANELNKYSIEKLVKTAQVTRNWLNGAANEQGSAYNIGAIDGTLSGTLLLFPKAIAVTLFRPFPWEVKKVIVALSALEALAVVYFTVQLFLKRRSKPIRLLVRDPNLLFCLVFTLIFAFAVGASSGNFGTLSRYKIPCLPFYGAILAIMLGKEEKAEPEKRGAGAQRRIYPAI